MICIESTRGAPVLEAFDFAANSFLCTSMTLFSALMSHSTSKAIPVWVSTSPTSYCSLAACSWWMSAHKSVVKLRDLVMLSRSAAPTWCFWSSALLPLRRKIPGTSKTRSINSCQTGNRWLCCDTFWKCFAWSRFSRPPAAVLCRPNFSITLVKIWFASCKNCCCRLLDTTHSKLLRAQWSPLNQDVGTWDDEHHAVFVEADPLIWNILKCFVYMWWVTREKFTIVGRFKLFNSISKNLQFPLNFHWISCVIFYFWLKFKENFLKVKILQIAK